MRVRIFIGGKEVQKEDLGNYTIKSEKLNRILASKVYFRENKEKGKNKY